MSILRDYQRAGVDAFWQALTPDVNRIAIEMATGLGKTILFAGAIVEWLRRNISDAGLRGAPQRALVLVHTDELVRQAVAKIEAENRGRFTVGVVKASQNEVTADIIVASVATLIQPGRMEQIQDVGFIVVDECHHATAPSYVKILKWFGAVCSCVPVPDPSTGSALHSYECGDRRTPVLGVTATLARSDGQGLGSAWQDMPFSRSLTWGIRKGYLVDLVPYTIKIPEVDAGATDAALDEVLSEGIAPEVVVTAWAEKTLDICEECLDAMRQVSEDEGHPCIPGYCPNEECGIARGSAPSTVLFAPLVRSAEAFADAFNAAGIKAEVVAGAYGDDHNQAVEARFRAGVTTVVCNAMKWTEGLDIPRVKCVIVARPTQSIPLFIQMVGRGLRPWLDAEAPPREDQRCILLCVQGTTTDLATVADLSDKVAEVQDGKSLTAMEDEWDIGKGIEDAPELYRGPVRVEKWDKIVQASRKAWNYTRAGAPFLPTAKWSRGYVFIVQRGDEWTVWHRGPEGGRFRTSKVATAPDLELAMAMAEDEAQERGGPGVGALLADRSRAWRKDVPSAAMQSQARRLGLGRELDKILAQRASGKAGRLSDLISRTEASNVLDPVVAKIKAKSVVPPA